jgi:hypothetical protein
MRFYKLKTNQPRTTKTNRNQSGPTKTSQDQPKPTETNQDQPKPIKVTTKYYNRPQFTPTKTATQTVLVRNKESCKVISILPRHLTEYHTLVFHCIFSPLIRYWIQVYFTSCNCVWASFSFPSAITRPSLSMCFFFFMRPWEAYVNREFIRAMVQIYGIPWIREDNLGILSIIFMTLTLD